MYLKKEVSGEVNFLHADKHGSLLQIDTMILMKMNKHSQSFHNGKFEIKLIFCMQVNIKFSYNMILSLLMDKIKHSQHTQSNKFAISLQYLK